MSFPTFDKTIHEQTKLKILAYLSSNDKASFMELRKSIDLTSGNLSIQLKNLEESRFIKQNKKIEKRKPITTVEITKEGRDALLNYLDEMERLLSYIKGGT